MPSSIYPKILGDAFIKLKPSLQYSHGSISHLKAKGSIDVVYGKNIFALLINKISKMPPKGADQPIELIIQRSPNKETWKRIFKNQLFITHQYLKNGLLYEKSGLITLVFHVSEVDGAIHFNQKQTLFAGIPMPRLLSANTMAVSTEHKNGWSVSLQVKSPVFGLILKYTGVVTIIE